MKRKINTKRVTSGATRGGHGRRRAHGGSPGIQIPASLFHHSC